MVSSNSRLWSFKAFDEATISEKEINFGLLLQIFGKKFGFTFKQDCWF